MPLIAPVSYVCRKIVCVLYVICEIYIFYHCHCVTEAYWSIVNFFGCCPVSLTPSACRWQRGQMQFVIVMLAFQWLSIFCFDQIFMPPIVVTLKKTYLENSYMLESKAALMAAHLIGVVFFLLAFTVYYESCWAKADVDVWCFATAECINIDRYMGAW